MISMPTHIFCAVEAIDMRTGIDGLSLCVQQALGKSPCDGSAYVFRNRRSNRIKLLVWDSTGARLCQRRLQCGNFIWPKAGDTTFNITVLQWHWLVAGVD